MNKKKSKLFIIFSIVVCFILSGYVVLADTGFDIDYDFDFGGGGFDFGDGDFSFGGGSAFDSDITSLVFLVLMSVVIVTTIISSIKSKTTNKDVNAEHLEVKHNDFEKVHGIWLDNSDTKIPKIDKDKFVIIASEMYVKMQEAWVNFDYDTLRSLTTDDLYNSYKTMLDTLKRKNQRNIIDDITIYTCTFNNPKVENGKYSIDVTFDLAMRDYIVNKDTSSIVRGMNVRLDVACVVTFVRTEKAETTKCPVCGAPIKEDNQSDVCEFCHNTIVKENYGWLISKKKVTKQKVIHD